MRWPNQRTYETLASSIKCENDGRWYIIVRMGGQPLRRAGPFLSLHDAIEIRERAVRAFEDALGKQD